MTNDNSAWLGDATATSLTTAYTNNGNILFVAAFSQTANVTGITYNGVAMTALASSPLQVPASFYCYFYYLQNPATGSNNVVISKSGSDFIRGLASSYTGTLSGIEAEGTNTGSSVTSINKSVSSAFSNGWSIAFVGNSGATTLTAGTSTTGRIIQVGTGIFDSNGPVSGSTTLNINNGGTSNMAMIMATFGGAPSNGILLFM